MNHRLPRMVALVAVVFYALTASWTTTLNGLALDVKVAGWDWQPSVAEPLTWLATLPLQLLPTGWIPCWLNLLFAIVGALTLGLLARSVELMPWDCAPSEEKPWVKHLPALLACVICGFEFNFWQEATAGAGVMINQLLIAAVIWCLLEYRVEKEARWLNAAALIWGAGMAQNWVMLLNLPLFIAALIWLRKTRFFKWDFLVRMALLGLAGLSIYALLPLVNGLNPHSPFSLGEAWLATWKTTKRTIWLLYAEFWAQHRLLTAAVLLYFLIPILPCLVRLEDRGGKNKSMVEQLQLWIYRVARAALLLACLWLAFSPSLGPQQILRQQFGLNLPLLTFDYLNALGIAFLAGNFLFLSQSRPARRARRQSEKIISWLRYSAPALLLAAIVALAAGLLARNAGAIFSTHRQPLENFGNLVADSLPAEGGILLGNENIKLAVVQAALAHRADKRHWLVVDFLSLPSPEYRARLDRQQSLGWLTAENKHELNPVEQLRLLARIAQTNRMFFLQPTPGHYLFEQFFPKPHNALAELTSFDSGQPSSLSLSADELAAGEKFWDEAWQNKMSSIAHPAAVATTHSTKISDKLFRWFYLEPVAGAQRELLGRWYSAALNGWGVELQHSARLPAAQHRFEQALTLNPGNLAAAINLECNTNFQAGVPLNLDGLDSMISRFGDLKKLGQAMSNFGPFDEPAICFWLGSFCRQVGMLRQTATQMERACVLAPSALPPELMLAELYARYRLDDKVFEIIKRVRANAAAWPKNRAAEADLELSLLEARTWVSQTNLPQARHILQSILQTHPNDVPAANLVFKAYVAFGDLTNALDVIAAQLARNTNDVAAMNNQAGLFIQLNQAAAAIPVLTRALTLTNLPAIRLNRAIAYLQNRELGNAEAEYHQLENEPAADAFSVHYGLGAIAEQQHNTNLALQHLAVCLSNAAPGTARWEDARKHRDALQNPASHDAPALK